MADYSALADRAAEYLGITDAGMKAELMPYIRSAVVILTMQTGEVNFSDDAAQQAVVFKAAVMYTDRLAEMSGKEGAAMTGFMKNLDFALRLKNTHPDSEEGSG